MTKTSRRLCKLSKKTTRRIDRVHRGLQWCESIALEWAPRRRFAAQVGMSMHSMHTGNGSNIDGRLISSMFPLLSYS